MKKSVITIAGLGLASGLAFAQEQSTTQDYDPSRDIVTESEQNRDVGMGETQHDTPVNSDYGNEPVQDYGTDSTEDYGSGTTDDYGTDTDASGSADPAYDSQASQDETWDTTDSDPVMEDEYETQAGSTDSVDLTEMGQANVPAEELKGMTVLSVDGEEIGEIDEVRYSQVYKEDVVVIEAGGFLGVGEKRVAVPLSELQQTESGTEGHIQTNLTRESIESQEEFDEAAHGAGESATDGEDYGARNDDAYGADQPVADIYDDTQANNETDTYGATDPMAGEHDTHASQDETWDTTGSDPVMEEEYETQASQDGAYDSTAPVTEDEYDTQASQDDSYESTDPMMDEEYDTQASQDDSYESTDPMIEDEYEAQAQTDGSIESADPTEMGQANLPAEQLEGMTVLSIDGEEIGEIDQVGYSTTHQERIVVVEAGGFLGVGEKRIAIPLSELGQADAASAADSIQSNLSRESIEAEAEFDEAGFTPDDATE